MLEKPRVQLISNHIDDVLFTLLKALLCFLGGWLAVDLKQELNPIHGQLVISQWLNGSLNRNNDCHLIISSSQEDQKDLPDRGRIFC